MYAYNNAFPKCRINVKKLYEIEFSCILNNTHSVVSKYAYLRQNTSIDDIIYCYN